MIQPVLLAAVAVIAASLSGNGSNHHVESAMTTPSVVFFGEDGMANVDESCAARVVTVDVVSQALSWIPRV